MESVPPRVLARAALLLAATLLFQSLRLILPIPPLFSTILIGSLVNACLFLALETAGSGWASAISVAAPVAAYLQQFLPLPVLIVPVALGNACYVAILHSTDRFTATVRIFGAAAGKAMILFAMFSVLLGWLNLPAKLSTALLVVMGWPQLISGILGGYLGMIVLKRVKSFL